MCCALWFFGFEALFNGPPLSGRKCATFEALEQPILRLAE
jgi:hypothetical protein